MVFPIAKSLSQILLCQNESELKRQSIEWKHTDFPIKENVPDAEVSKEGDVQSLRHKRIQHWLFP